MPLAQGSCGRACSALFIFIPSRWNAPAFGSGTPTYWAEYRSTGLTVELLSQPLPFVEIESSLIAQEASHAMQAATARFECWKAGFGTCECKARPFVRMRTRCTARCPGSPPKTAPRSPAAPNHTHRVSEDSRLSLSYNIVHDGAWLRWWARLTRLPQNA